MFIGLYFFRTLQLVKEKKMIDTRLSLTKKALSVVFISFRSIPRCAKIYKIYQKTPKFSKNVKQKIGKKGVHFRRIIKGERNVLDDIIMYQTNPCRVL